MKIDVRKDIYIRTLIPADAKQVFDVIDQNRAALRPWLTWVDNTKSPDTVRDVIESWEKASKAGTDTVFGIFYKDYHIGTIGLHDRDPIINSAMIGYWLTENEQGQGIMTDCVRSVLDYGFQALNLNRIYIHCAAGNTKSQAIPERLGFVKEGVLQDGECLYGSFQDLFIYGMLKRNWLC